MTMPAASTSLAYCKDTSSSCQAEQARPSPCPVEMVKMEKMRPALGPQIAINALHPALCFDKLPDVAAALPIVALLGGLAP